MILEYVYCGAVCRAANPGGTGDTSPQYLTSIPPIILIFAHCREIPNILPPCWQ